MSLTRNEIHHIRQSQHWSKRKTAQFLGIPESSYRLYEQGGLTTKRTHTLDNKLLHLNKLDILTPNDLHRIRNMFDWSKKRMAAYLDISESAYRNYEAGRKQLPLRLYPKLYKSSSARTLFPDRSQAFAEWYAIHTGTWSRKHAYQKYMNQYHYANNSQLNDVTIDNALEREHSQSDVTR